MLLPTFGLQLLLPGVEFSLHRVGVGLALDPSAYEFELASELYDSSGTELFDTALGVEARFDWSWSAAGSPHGLVLGCGLSHRLAEGDGESLQVSAVRGRIGYGHALTNQIAVCLGPSVEYGRADMDFDPPGESIAVDGDYLRLGIGAELVYDFGERWALFLALDYVGDDFDLAGDGIELGLERRGLVFGLGLHWNFGLAPTVLE